MAELILKIGTTKPDPAYQDGDILCAFNACKIHCCHGEMLCHVKDSPKINGRHRVQNHLSFLAWMPNMREYKFERTAEQKVKRTNLITRVVDELTDIPNGNGESLDVDMFIRRRIKNPRHAIFGTYGKEIWFGGRTRMEMADVTALWVAIEANSRHRKVDHSQWPLTRREKQMFLALPVDDFDNSVRVDLESSVYDRTNPDKPILLKKRKHHVADWKGLMPLGGRSVEEVEDEKQEIDLRTERALKRADLVTTKG